MKLTQATAQTIVVDGIGAFPKGMNAGKAPQLLEPGELAYASNASIRGDFLSHRSAYRRLTIDYTGPFNGGGLYQGCCYYQPDYGDESIVAAIQGRLYQFFPGPGTCRVVDITNGVTMDPGTPEHFLWQSEKWLINQDGQSQPRIFDGTTTFQSAAQSTLGTISAPVTIPAVGSAVAIVLQSPYAGAYYIKVNVFDNSNVFIGQYLLQPNTAASPQATITLFGTIGAVPLPQYQFVRVPNTWCTLIPVAVSIGSGNFNVTVKIPLLVQYLGNIGDSVFVKDQGVFGDQYFGGTVTNTNASYTDSNNIQWPAIEVHFNNAPIGGFHALQFIWKGNFPSFQIISYLTAAFTPPGLASLSAAFGGPAQQVWIASGTEPSQHYGAPYTPYWMTPLTGASINVALLNLTGTAGNAIPALSTIRTIAQLPPGRAGLYVLGRNWMSLSDALSYIASDMVGGQSGTVGVQYRDAVLYGTENQIVAGGGSFRVPGNSGTIKFMADLATLDASLGQGPVQIGTRKKVFSCNAPYLTQLDRQNWQSATNPIVTESLVGQGGVGQRSAVVVNSDLLFRSGDGLRSLVLARREFNTWGNTPISNELDDILAQDPPDLLPFCSAIEFDNRFLFTTKLTQGQQGVYGQWIGVINFDPISTLRGKAPAVYDGVWKDLNVLQFVKGDFAGVERCFAFVSNTSTNLIELWEILPSPSTTVNKTLAPEQYLDNSVSRITWYADTGILFQAVTGKDKNDLCQLKDGELYIDALQGETTIAVYFRPDYDTTWHLWRRMTMDASPSYQPRIGLGEPPAGIDPTTQRPWRDGYSFQFRIEVTGRCIVMGARFSAVVLPTPTFAPPQFAKPSKPLPPAQQQHIQKTGGNTFRILAAGDAAVNQDYTKDTLSTWVSQDGLYTVESFGLFYSLYLTAAPGNELYHSLTTQFPFAWTIANGTAPAPFGEYV